MLKKCEEIKVDEYFICILFIMQNVFGAVVKTSLQITILPKTSFKFTLSFSSITLTNPNTPTKCQGNLVLNARGRPKKGLTQE